MVIPNGVSEDVREFSRVELEEPIVTYAGRVEDYKRVDLAVRVIARAQGILGVKIRFRVIGDGPAMDKVREVAKTHGIELIHTGFLPRRDYLRELSRSSAFINLSRYEAFSIVTAEALALGLPAVVARPWGLTFSSFGAYVVDPSDVDGAAEVLAKVISEPSKVRAGVPTWGEVVRDYVEKLYAASSGL